MTRDALEAHVNMVIYEATRPLTFDGVMAGVVRRARVHHGEVGFRALDGALQALRRRSVIRYQKSQGAKGTHGWVPFASPLPGEGGGS